ncbi:formylglycine-generating enzyme family protein [Neisseria zalophi]|uniref:Sulfatase-modifying factor enzyme-like domain-containing protein n=1 Tax=Neisseria zalophi TaxID=640030 RepID=A0A5J6Q0C8_9NEIS|nr:SUMF1/EgtB/PvdO family nonheme iron enzyme [Neisseria zalophi]QEY26497.1 hypothetical protein D0T92_08115 [Neisseria zalophi]
MKHNSFIPNKNVLTMLALGIISLSACSEATNSTMAPVNANASSAGQTRSGDHPPTFANPNTTPFSPQTAPQSAQAVQNMVNIPAGTYTIGRDDGPAIEKPAHQVTLPAFKIDRTEVTNAAFAEYLNAMKIPVNKNFEGGYATRDDLPPESVRLLMEEERGGGLYPIIALDDPQARIGYQNGKFVVNEGYANHPVTESTWAGARAYCEWRGGHLPSEVEWEAAARGQDARLYPWGNSTPNSSRVFVSGRTGVTSEVGSRPAGASPFGALDMSGSQAEWTSSLLRPYPYNADDGRESADSPDDRVTRGGDYMYDANADTLTATHRKGFSNLPYRGHRHIGFRCAG